MRARHVLAALAIASAWPSLPRHAHADQIDACVTAATDGQKSQRQGKLRSARASFLQCVKPECPAEVRSVCDKLLAGVEASLPTIVLGARDSDGRDVPGVTVTLDGEPFASKLDGKELPVDPGQHALRFDRPDGVNVTVSLLVREAEKNRLVTATFTATPPAGPAGSAGAGGAEGGGAGSPRPGIPVLASVFAAVAVASLGTFTVLAIRGQAQYDQCNPHKCDQSTIDSLSLQRDIAFGALGLGVVAAGAATWLYFSRPSASRTSGHASSTLSLGLGGGPGGALLIASGSFR